MARIRTIKPEFFTHDAIAELPPLHRLLFIGLWTQADREGRLEDRPKRLKVALLPYDDGDVDTMLDDLHRAGFILRYEHRAGTGQEPGRYVAIPGFLRHQNPHVKEPPSLIPPPSQGEMPARFASGSGTGPAPGKNSSGREEGKGREDQEGKDPGGAVAPVPPELIPEDLDPDRLTPSRLAELWNHHVGDPAGRNRVRAIGKLESKAREAIKLRPRASDWEPAFAHAREMLLELGDEASWVTLEKLLRDPDKFAAAAWAWKLEQARRAKPPPPPADDGYRRVP